MAQTLYYNGTILTMEDRCPRVEAVLTEDGRILETGTWEKIKERAGDKTRRLDLQGRVMLPGFIDSHSHFTACASHTMEADLSGARSFEDILTCIRQYIADKKIPEGKWVTASGYFLSAGARSAVCPIMAILIRFTFSINWVSVRETEKPGKLSSLSIVPPVWPRPRPDILAY